MREFCAPIGLCRRSRSFIYDRGLESVRVEGSDARTAAGPPGADRRRRSGPSPRDADALRAPPIDLGRDGGRFPATGQDRRVLLPAYGPTGGALGGGVGRDPGGARVHAGVLLVSRPPRRARTARPTGVRAERG